MSHPVYPVILTRLDGAVVVVVGGGAVGERKISGLLAVGAVVRVISPQISSRLEAFSREGQICWEQRPYRTGDLQGASLVFAATDQRAVDAQVARDAAAANILCNVVDAPDEGTFHVPAVFCGGGVTVAVSTAGQSPRRAQRIRDQIAALLAGSEEQP
jgi:cobalt-precorrin 5A hydrolase/precorrin-3B C17-methyltransferase